MEVSLMLSDHNDGKLQRIGKPRTTERGERLPEMYVELQDLKT